MSKFVLEMQGGNKGLLVNSTNLCKGNHQAICRIHRPERQALRQFEPVLTAKACGKGKKKHGGGAHHR